MKTASPMISVIMPVLNAESYIQLAIESMLGQTFTDFELIIIDDGSTDRSAKIIHRFKDPRIQLIQRENRGLVPSLNEAIARAKGKYIARMDADDISRPDRLAVQAAYLEKHPQAAVVSSYVKLIAEDGTELAPWVEDRAATTPAEIKSLLTQTSCYAHPAIMIRTKILQTYGFRNMKPAEDYDLWLRLISDGHELHKIPEELYSYRILKTSIIGQVDQSRVRKRIAAFKLRYLWGRLVSLQWHTYESAVLVGSLKDYLRPFIGFVKRCLRAPFLIIGLLYNRILLWLVGVLVPRPAASDRKRLAIIVPWLTVGGADKLLIELANGLRDTYDITVFTTEQSLNEWQDKLEGDIDFQPLGSARWRRLVPYRLARQLVTGRFSRLLISNAALGYQTLPLIKQARPKLETLDVLHGQGGKFERAASAPAASLPYHAYLDRRITVNKYLIGYMHETYKLKASDFQTIYNGIDPQLFAAPTKGYLKQRHSGWRSKHILTWVGRMSAEKRPLEALRSFVELAQDQTNVALCMVGDGPLLPQLQAMKRDLPQNIRDRVDLLGSTNRVSEVLADTHVLFMTSEIEGLPIVLIEALMSGVPCVAPSVGGIPEIIDAQVGALVDPTAGAAEYAQALRAIVNTPSLHKKMSQAARQRSTDFTLEKMLAQYEGVIG